MKAVIIDRPGAVRVDEVPDPSYESNEVLIEVGACGICGTDIHILDGEFPPTKYPIVPGHEFGGTVREIGSDVQGIAVGDRVGVDPSLPCGACYFCQRGQENLCER